jgi:hypothetical protein
MDGITNTLRIMDAITQKRQRLETESNAPRYDSRATLETGVIALESFVSIGSHGIAGETQRLMIHMN